MPPEMRQFPFTMRKVSDASLWTIFSEFSSKTLLGIVNVSFIVAVSPSIESEYASDVSFSESPNRIFGV